MKGPYESPIRIIDNKAIRARHQEERSKSKRIKKLKAKRQRRREQEEQDAYAQEYLKNQKDVSVKVSLGEALRSSREQV